MGDLCFCIYTFAVDSEFKMQMASEGVSRVTDQTDNGALFNVLSTAAKS